LSKGVEVGIEDKYLQREGIFNQLLGSGQKAMLRMQNLKGYKKGNLKKYQNKGGP
jgi:hypothetical protein